MVSGGAGALVWMWISACFGLSSKFSECMLAIKYREVNEKGEMSGGPMYTMKKALKNKKLGAVLGWLFALFAVIASFGIGNMTQGNSISTAVHETFGVSVSTVGADHRFSFTDHHRWNKNDIKSIFCRSSSDGNLLCDRRCHCHSWEYQ